MKLDLSKISVSKEEQIDAREIFNSLINKSSKYNGYLRDVQSEVLDKWFEKRNRKDNLIKMNTGSGKTVVALLILQSCLNETNENCIYVVPDNYLMEQVKKEASDLGIKVTTDVKSLDFVLCKAILIITMHRLVNGKSIFGLSSQSNIEIGSILIDDVHTCLDIAEQQSKLTIKRKDNRKVYDGITKLFSNALKQQNEGNSNKIFENDYTSSPMLIPFWNWQEQTSDVSRLLVESSKDSSKNDLFNLPLIEDILPLCNCVISYDRIEISPKCLPINKISRFQNAKRRIYLSATLSDDSVMVTDFDVNGSDINDIIVPNKASDIGDRMILYPQVLNTTITDDEIKSKLKEISKNKRVVVIVPSFLRANYWADVANNIFKSKNIEEVQEYDIGLDIIVNRYDGIDLPNNKCRVLVIDGLPFGKTIFDAVLEKQLSNSESIVKNKIQKIEQGMGRGVRSNEDYCAIVLMGRDLIHTMYNSNATKYFSPATQAQIKLSNKISEQLQGKSLNDIMGIFNYCLERDIEWRKLGKNSLSRINSVSSANVSEDSQHIRDAFNLALRNNFQGAVDCFNKINNDNKYYMGWIEQEKASYLCMIDQKAAQSTLVSAVEKNIYLLKPIIGVKKRNLDNYKLSQKTNIIKLIEEKNLDEKGYLIYVEMVLSKIIFIPKEIDDNAFKTFEESIKQVGELLGFISLRPEQEQGDGGPDNFWIIGNGKGLVIECKSGASTDEICKTDCGQLLSSLQWFENTYGRNGMSPIPIMIHPAKIFAKDSSPRKDFRGMTDRELQIMIKKVRKFAIAFSNSGFKEEKILELLDFHQLSSNNIIDLFIRI